MGIDLRNEYFEWLKHMVFGYKNNEYNILLKDLWGVQFRWLISNDVNRVFDGRNLRNNFCETIDIDMCESMTIDGCSLLEVIAAIALRCEWIMMDDSNNLDVSYWFKLFMMNLELDLFTDEDYYTHGGRSRIYMIFDRFMNRTYSKTGKGGLFPLRVCDKNQRKVEIWTQMNTYLVENYYEDKK